MTERKTRKVGRPSKAETARVAEGSSRPRRSSTGGYRDKLAVRGMNPDYNYRWVADIEENGIPMAELEECGYEYAPAEEHQVGEKFIYNASFAEGSIVRMPAGKSGGYMYLMRQRKEWYEADQREKAKERLDVEKQRLSEFVNPQDEGFYGELKIK